MKLRLTQEFGFAHLSAGDLLREERDIPGSKYGELIDWHLKEGVIIPVEITCSLLEKAMNKRMTSAVNGDGGGDNTSRKRFLIDGFPRNQNNYDGWQREMSGKVNVHFVLYFDCPEEVCIDRCLSRGAAGSGRTDDNEDSLRKRMNVFEKDTWPIIQLYQSRGQVESVDGTLDADQVYQKVRQVFSRFK